MKTIWRDLEAAGPEIARLGDERFDRARVALLDTVRKNGSPRISAVEPCLRAGPSSLGVMSWSAKRRDRVPDRMACLSQIRLN